MLRDIQSLDGIEDRWVVDDLSVDPLGTLSVRGLDASVNLCSGWDWKGRRVLRRHQYWVCS